MYTEIRPFVDASRRPLLICHVAPDGDAIGSLLGLTRLLEAQGKRVVAASPDGVPRNLTFLTGADQVVTACPDASCDLVISLDCSDLDRMGSVYKPEWHGRLPLVNIDHHVTNLNFGTLNLVDSTAPSTCEMLFELAQALGWAMDAATAQCLLTGVVTDTRSFRTSNVTAKTLGVAQQLMMAGASLTEITENVLNRRPLASICLWGHALVDLHLEDRIVWVAVPQALRTRCDNVEQSDTGLVSFLGTAEEADVSVVFAERDDGNVDVGMRARPGWNVADVALSLGGGGHPQAAGCSLRISLAEAQALVLSALRESLTRQRMQ